MTGNTFHNVGDPTVDQVVATKTYVDSNNAVIKKLRKLTQAYNYDLGGGKWSA